MDKTENEYQLGLKYLSGDENTIDYCKHRKHSKAAALAVGVAFILYINIVVARKKLIGMKKNYEQIFEKAFQHFKKSAEMGN
ncbi:18328_t:CDS:1, partial [Gigaspora margarita]